VFGRPAKARYIEFLLHKNKDSGFMAGKKAFFGTFAPQIKAPAALA